MEDHDDDFLKQMEEEQNEKEEERNEEIDENLASYREDT